MEVINALGRRKAAVARVYVKEGAGQITINGRDLNVYFPSSILQYVVKQPLEKLGVAENMTSRLTLTVADSRVRQKLCVWLSHAHWLRSTLKTRVL